MISTDQPSGASQMVRSSRSPTRIEGRQLAGTRGRRRGHHFGCVAKWDIVVSGTLEGFPNPPAMGSGEQSSPSPDAALGPMEDVVNQGTLRVVVVGLSLLSGAALAQEKPVAAPPKPAA